MAAATEFHALTIEHLSHQPGDALVLTFAVPPALTDLYGFRPGQHVTLRAVLDGEELRRTYSICAGPAEPLRIAIKRCAGGRFSNWAHDSLRASMTIDVMPPSGRFVLPPPDGTPRHIVAIAAGSGITPVLGIARQALAHETATRVTLVYANRSRDSVMFAEELEALKDLHLGRFDYIAVFSRTGEVESPLFEGRITGDKVAALGDTLIDFAAAARIYLCGPGNMIKQARDALMARGIPAARIAHEFFASAMSPASQQPPSPLPAAAAPAVGPRVTVILDGARHQLVLAAGETILQAALKAGVKAPYACAGGMCSTCRARIVDGSATMLLNYSLEPWEVARGFTLACQAVPTSNSLTLDWDAM